MAKYLQAHLNRNYWNYSAFDFYKYFPQKNLKNPVFKSTFFCTHFMQNFTLQKI